MKKNRKKKILIIGFGSISKKLFNFLKGNTKYETGILRVFSKEKISGCKCFFKTNDAIKFKAEYIFICCSANLHNFYFKIFKNKENKIFIEKPLAINKREVLDYEKYKYNVLVGYFLRFHPAIIFIKKYIQKNIKKVRIINLEVGYDVRKWRPQSKIENTVSVNKRLGGGAIFELSHEIDLAVWFLGKPDEIYCERQKLTNLDSNVEDVSKIIFNNYKNKTLCSINLDLIQTKYSRSIKIILDDKTIFFDYKKNQIFIYSSKKTKIINFAENMYDAYYKQINFFLKKFNKKEKNNNNLNKYANIKSSLDLTKIIFLLFKSAKLKKKLKFK